MDKSIFCNHDCISHFLLHLYVKSTAHSQHPIPPKSMVGFPESSSDVGDDPTIHLVASLHPSQASVGPQRRPQILPRVPPQASLDTLSTATQADIRWQRRSHPRIPVCFPFLLSIVVACLPAYHPASTQCQNRHDGRYVNQLSGSYHL